MSKPIALLISFILLMTLAMTIVPQVSEGDSSPARQPVKLHMYGDSDNGNISSEQPTSDEDETAECPDDGDKQLFESDVGTWRSEPFETNAAIGGAITFQVWAKTTQGTVKDVAFTCDISVDGNNIESLTTPRNDTDSSAKLFQANGNLGSTTVQAGQYIQIDIIYDGQDAYQDTSGDTIILYGSIDHPSNIYFPMGSVGIDFTEGDIEVNDENAETDKETIIVTTTISYAMGMDDMVGFDFEVTTVDYEGSQYDYELLEEETDHITIKWKWRYGDDHGPSGTYELNVTTRDRSGNSWWQTQPLRIITQIRPNIDFALSDSTLIIENAFTKKEGTVTITVECYGEDGIVGLTPQVNFEITTPELTKDMVIRTTVVDTQSETIVPIPYLFNSTGTYVIRIEVNPRDYESYEESNDLGTAEDNNVVTTTILVNPEPKKDDDKEWYEEIIDDIEDDQNYQIGLVAIVAVIIVVAVLLVVRRKRSHDEYEDDEE